MKAILSGGGSRQFLLVLTPEDDQDRANLKAFAEQVTRAHLFASRGFNYLDPKVEFLIQPMPSGD